MGTGTRFRLKQRKEGRRIKQSGQGVVLTLSLSQLQSVLQGGPASCQNCVNPWAQ